MTRRRWILLSAGAVIAAAIAAVAIGAALPQATDYEAYSPLVGRPAPPISGTTLIGGHPVSLAGFAGKYVVVNFFASWCVPCEDEAADLEQFSYDAAPRAALIGVEFEDVDATASTFLRQTGSTFPAISDPGEKIAMAYGVKGPPDTYLIAPDGRVVAHVAGPVTDRGLESLLSRAERMHP